MGHLGKKSTARSVKVSRALALLSYAAGLGGSASADPITYQYTSSSNDNGGAAHYTGDARVQ